MNGWHPKNMYSDEGGHGKKNRKVEGRGGGGHTVFKLYTSRSHLPPTLLSNGSKEHGLITCESKFQVVVSLQGVKASGWLGYWANFIVCWVRKFHPVHWDEVMINLSWQACIIRDCHSFVGFCNFTNNANSQSPKVNIRARLKLCYFGRCVANV